MGAKPQDITLTPGYAVLTCDTCGFDWETPRRKGRYPVQCPECLRERAIVIRLRVPRRGGSIPKDIQRLADGRTVKAYLALLHHCELRLVNEEAAALIRLGRHKEALAALESVPARRRAM